MAARVAQVTITAVLLLFLAGTTNATDTTLATATDTAATDEPCIALHDSMLVFDPDLEMPRRRNPLAAAGWSALVPGGGQLYCAQPARGGAFLAAATVAGLMTANRSALYRDASVRVNRLTDSIAGFRMMADTATNAGERAVLEYVAVSYEALTSVEDHDRRVARYSMHHGIGWTAGMYAWNILSAVQWSNHFYDDDGRSPAKAAWLSAIPALGLGQMYNGKFSKAGMIWTVQTMLAVQSYNYNRLKDNALEHLRISQTEYGGLYEREWRARYDESLRKRTMWLWYSIFFYFYGIFDAAVDAHLHDYRTQIRLEPVVEPADETVGMNLHFDF